MYHSAAQDFGAREFEFAARRCYGQQLPAEALTIPHASRIDEYPVPLGRGAKMTFLHADGGRHSSPNENSLVVRLDLGATSVLFMGDAEAGGRHDPQVAPSARSIEGILLACCLAELAADILIVGHHGSKTSSRAAFLDAVGASTFVVSSGPMRYGTVVLPDAEVIAELTRRGEVFRTDLNDATCGASRSKIGPLADGRPGGCDNIRIQIFPFAAPQIAYWPESES
jgi:beta-lactamase superfamily II metal-dependent hydrolase